MLKNMLKTCDLKIVKMCKKIFKIQKYTKNNNFTHSFKPFFKIVLHVNNVNFLSVNGGFLEF